MANQGIPVLNLPVQTSIPTSIDLFAFQRQNGVEKPIRLAGINLNALGGGGTATSANITQLESNISNASVAASQAVSIAAAAQSKVAQTSGVLDDRITSVNSQVLANQSQVSQNTQEVVSIRADVADFYARVSNVSVISDQAASLASIAGGLADRLSSVSILAAAAASIDSRLSLVSILAQQAVSVESRVDTLSAVNTSINALVQAVEDRVSNVSAARVVNSNAISSINVRASLNRVSVNSRFTSVNSRVTSVRNVLAARISNVSTLVVNVSGGGGGDVTSAQYTSLISAVADLAVDISQISARITSVNNFSFGNVTVLSGASVVISANYTGGTVLVNHNAASKAVIKSGLYGENRVVKVIQKGAGTVSITASQAAMTSGTGQAYYPIRLKKAIPPGFPIPIHHGMLPAGFFNDIQTDGGDIQVFTSVSNQSVKNRIPFAIVRINTASSILTGFATASVSLGQNSKIYVHVNPSVSVQPSANDQYGSRAVWYKYAFVTHDFTEDETGTYTTSILGTNSAVSAAILTKFNQWPMRGFGPQVGSASTDRVETNILSENFTTGYHSFLYDTVASTANQYIFSKDDHYTLDIGGNNRLRAFIRAQAGAYSQWQFEFQPKNTIAGNAPRHMSFAFSAVSNATAVLTENGSSVAYFYAEAFTDTSVRDISRNFRIGNGRSTDLNQTGHKGHLGGWRTMITVPTSTWKRLEYQSYLTPLSIAEASAKVSSGSISTSISLSINSRGDRFTLNGQYAVAELIFVDSSTAYLTGDLV